MTDTTTLLRLATLFLLIAWRLYWHVAERKSDKEKPKQRESYSLLSRKGFMEVVTYAIFGVVGVQLLGIQMLPLSQESLPWQLFGFVLVCFGIAIASVGRYSLGANWARSYEYQVKQKQELVTHGIYRFIRHPLYLGIALFLIGSELVVQSYLVIAYVFIFLAANQQAKWEEALLIKHFGTEYRRYMKRTKRFFPYIW